MDEYELRAILDSLRESGGSGTWHISLYIRPDKSLQSMKARIAEEISEAESIKSDETRSRVQSSLQKIDAALSQYTQTPDNGIIVFASPNECIVLDDLPFDCPDNRYHCGRSFLLDPLDSTFDVGATVGLIVVERGRASIGVLHRGRITSVIEKESQVMGKTQAGGQSQARYERLRENQKHEFFKNVQETAYGTFSGYDLDGVVIGGTLDTAKEFSQGYTNHEWDVLGTYSVDHGDESGLSELVERAQSAILSEEEASVRQSVERFLSALRDDLAEYGADRVETAIERGAAETVLLSTNLDADEIQRMSTAAEQMGSTVVMVEPSFEDAQMFENLSNGYGAILRYRF